MFSLLLSETQFLITYLHQISSPTFYDSTNDILFEKVREVREDESLAMTNTSDINTVDPKIYKNAGCVSSLQSLDI